MKKNKWEQWHDSLSPSLKEYLKNQPVWHDKDLFNALALGLIIGFIVGVIV
jgi:hypothetical protein